MGRKIDLDDLLDAVAVAELLGVSSQTVVATYRRRYDDFPAPVWASRGRRCQLWLRADVERWKASRGGAV
jgi:predicted DNA-binding transcriptional regulator AlpA